MFLTFSDAVGWNSWHLTTFYSAQKKKLFLPWKKAGLLTLGENSGPVLGRKVSFFEHCIKHKIISSVHVWKQVLNNCKRLWIWRWDFIFQFVTIEAVITVVVDFFPRLTKGCNREIFVFLYCAVSYVAGLSMVTNVSI